MSVKSWAQSVAWDRRYASIARRHGIAWPYRVLREGRAAGIPPALALAMIEQESGGHNVFGHDPTIFVGAGKVTREKYAAYVFRRRDSGNKDMQGVGPMQLTWWETQDRADRMGGCWKARVNIRCGFQLLAANIKVHGLLGGIRAYNGSGPRAEAYMRSVLAKRDVWHDRLFGSRQG